MASTAEDGALIGRTCEKKAIEALLDDLACGAGRVLVVEGEAGSGKTALLSHTHTEAERRGFQVCRGAATEVDRDRPLGPLFEALGLDRESPDEDLRWIALLLEGGLGRAPSTGSAELRYRIADAVVELLDRMAQKREVVLTLDDMHWADPLTLLSVRQFVRRLRHLPIGVVLAVRPSPSADGVPSALDDIDGADHGVRMTLGPLDALAVRELICREIGAYRLPGLLGVVEGAGGNAMFIVQLIAALRDENLIRIKNDTADLCGTPVLSTFRGTVRKRLRPLSEPARELVLLAAVLGASFTARDLALLLSQSASALAAPLREALVAGVLAEDGDRFRFAHDVLREAVYEAIPKSLRHALHLQVARSLADRGAAAIEVAHHYSLGAPPGDAEAITSLTSAARQVAAFAPTTAVDLLRRALDLIDRNDPSRDLLMTELALPLARSGRLSEAFQLANEVLGRTSAPSSSAASTTSSRRACKARDVWASRCGPLRPDLAAPVFRVRRECGSSPISRLAG